MNLIVNEIFSAIQGEGPAVGMPTIFVRLSKCNLSCKWCDTKYHTEGKTMTIEQVIKEIQKLKIKDITFTGGEPLLQEKGLGELMDKLGDKYYYSIETNGTILANELFDRIVVSPKKQAIKNNVLKSYSRDISWAKIYFKFVYENKNDLWWEDVITQNNILKPFVYIMPEGATRKQQMKKMPEVIDYCIKKELKFGARIHVLAFDTRRGV